jgi:hypothetical protein
LPRTVFRLDSNCSASARVMGTLIIER